MAKKKAVRKTAPAKPAPPAFPGRALQENLRSDIVRPVQNVLGIKVDGWYGVDLKLLRVQSERTSVHWL